MTAQLKKSARGSCHGRKERLRRLGLAPPPGRAREQGARLGRDLGGGRHPGTELQGLVGPGALVQLGEGLAPEQLEPGTRLPGGPGGKALERLGERAAAAPA